MTIILASSGQEFRTSVRTNGRLRKCFPMTSCGVESDCLGPSVTNLERGPLEPSERRSISFPADSGQLTKGARRQETWKFASYRAQKRLPLSELLNEYSGRAPSHGVSETVLSADDCHLQFGNERNYRGQHLFPWFIHQGMGPIRCCRLSLFHGIFVALLRQVR